MCVCVQCLVVLTTDYAMAVMRAKARRVLSVPCRGGVSYRGSRDCWWTEEQWKWGYQHFGDMSPSGAEAGQVAWSECTQNLRISPWINVSDSLTVSSNALTSTTSTTFWLYCTENVMLSIASGGYVSRSLWLHKIICHHCHEHSPHSFPSIFCPWTSCQIGVDGLSEHICQNFNPLNVC